MSYNDILLRCARSRLWRPLRNSAFRKYCRRNRDQSIVAATNAGFQMKLIIGDSVDNQIFIYGMLEPGTTNVVNRLSKDCDSFIDVGCNIGYFSCLFGSRNKDKPLIAIDPNPTMIRRTEENLALNGIQNRTLLNVGIGAERDTLRLHISRRRHSLSSFAYVPEKDNCDSIEVDVRSLSDVIAEHHVRNALVKIDTEGFEYQVFRGLSNEAAATIRFIVFELASANLRSAGVSARDLLSLPAMQEFDLYRISDVEENWISPASSAGLFGNDRIHGNVLLARKGARITA